MAKSNDGLWVLLWSKRQNAFHVEPVDRMLASNRTAYTGNKGGDYRALHIGYLEEVESMRDSCNQTLAMRARRVA